MSQGLICEPIGPVEIREHNGQREIFGNVRIQGYGYKLLDRSKYGEDGRDIKDTDYILLEYGDVVSYSFTESRMSGCFHSISKKVGTKVYGESWTVPCTHSIIKDSRCQNCGTKIQYIPNGFTCKSTIND